MNIFSNPLDEPSDHSKLFAIIVYILLCALSIYATAESIISSFDISHIFAYAFTISLFALLSYMLSIIKDGLENRNLGKIIIASIVFFIGWGISLSTNTHKFFTMLKLKDIRNEEIGKAITSITNLNKKSNSIGLSVISDYTTSVDNKINQFYEEMTNEKNFGYSTHASKLHSEVESLLKETIDVNRFLARNPRTRTEFIKTANEISKEMRSSLKSITESMQTQLSSIDSCINKTELKIILKKLENCNSFINDVPTSECKQNLNDAHHKYDLIYDCSENILVNSLGIPKNPLPNKELKIPVPSINLEKINALIPFVFSENSDNSDNKHLSSFLISLLLAFVIDLGAFVLLYNKILDNEN